MGTQTRVFIATSLDGFIARPDGGLDWLDAASAAIPPGEDCGYGAFMAGIDAIIMGRRTFEKVLSFDAWPYGSTPVTVLSRSWDALPAKAPASASLSSASPRSIVADLSSRGVAATYVDGGETIRRFLADGLIDEMTITTVPVLIGEGRPLFGVPMQDIAWDLVSSQSYPFGFVQNRYRRVN